MSPLKRLLIPLGFGLAGMALLSGFYFGLMSWAVGFSAARALFQADRWIYTGLIVGFGLQAALYAVMRFHLFVPAVVHSPGGLLLGTSGGTSVVAMLACCMHHVTDLLPILGLTAATVFLTRYRLSLLWAGLAVTIAGTVIMLVLLLHARRMTVQALSHHLHTSETT